MISEKVRPHHLERKALLYVRQSSAHQVLHNRESSALQYAMRDRLTALGWCSRTDSKDIAFLVGTRRMRFCFSKAMTKKLDLLSSAFLLTDLLNSAHHAPGRKQNLLLKTWGRRSTV